MRVLSAQETCYVSGGLRAGTLHPQVAAASRLPIGKGGPTANYSIPTFQAFYNVVKNGSFTPSEIAENLYTNPGSTMTMTEAQVAAADIVSTSVTLSAAIGYEIGTVAYNNMDVETQDAIGGTIDAALDNMSSAYFTWEDGF